MVSKVAVCTADAAEMGGPYAQAVTHRGLIFLSGQGAVDPCTNQVTTGTIEHETRLAMENIRIIMEAADERSQQDAAEVGMTTRTAVAEYGGPYLAAANQTLAEGMGSYDKKAAVGIVRSKLGEFLPLVGSGELTAEEALAAAAEAYIEEATAQGYIQ